MTLDDFVNSILASNQPTDSYVKRNDDWRSGGSGPLMFRIDQPAVAITGGTQISAKWSPLEIANQIAPILEQNQGWLSLATIALLVILIFKRA